MKRMKKRGILSPTLVKALNTNVAPKTKATIVSVILPIGSPLLCRKLDGTWEWRKSLKQATYASNDIMYGIGMPGAQAGACELAVQAWNERANIDRPHDAVYSYSELVAIHLPEVSGYDYIVTHHKYMLGSTAMKKNVMFVHSDRSDEYWHVTLNELATEPTACDCPAYIFMKGKKTDCKHMLKVKTIMTDLNFQKKTTP